MGSDFTSILLLMLLAGGGLYYFLKVRRTPAPVLSGLSRRQRSQRVVAGRVFSRNPADGNGGQRGHQQPTKRRFSNC